MDYITDVESRHKCAHEQCQCQIPSTQEYCSDFCSEAEDIEEVELAVRLQAHAMRAGLE